MEKPEKKLCGTCDGKRTFRDIHGGVIDCPHCYLIYQWNECCDAWERFLSREVDKITNELMGAFPKSYPNSNIIAYQNGVEKYARAILKKTSKEPSP